MTHIVSDVMRQSIEGSSWIRRMFEEGARLKAQVGAENVFDLSLGNPLLEPPEGFKAALRALIDDPAPGRHRYIPNAGLPETRAFVAEELRAATGLAYTGEQIVMTVGAAGGLNIALKALLNPGDEVLVPAPYFPEYDFYVANHGGRLLTVATTAEFQLDPAAFEQLLSPRTRAVLLNSPNNPTGVIYPAASLRALAAWLENASARIGRPIFLLSDEPYRHLAFDGTPVPWLPPLYAHTLVITSHSKDLGLAGERIGYVAVSPQAAEAPLLMDALVLANRILGFVNAPALFQRALPLLKGKRVDAGYYERLRDRMVPPLRAMGYQVVNPQGAFYVFPRTPIADDVAFVRACQQERLLIVPGSGFAGPGHFRASLAVAPPVIDRALPVFEKVLKAFGG